MKSLKKPDIQFLSAWLMLHPKDMDAIKKTDKRSMFLGFTLLGSLLINLYQENHPPGAAMILDSPGVDTRRNDSSMSVAMSLNSPINSLPIIGNWVTHVSQDIFSFDFNSIDTHRNAIRKYFSDEGWDSYINAMTPDNSLERIVIDNRNVAQSVATNPAIQSELAANDDLARTFRHWTFQVPVITTLSAGNRQSVTHRIYEFEIREDPTSYYGRVIESISQK